VTQEKEYTLKEAAKVLGVHRDSIIYWEKNNMIPKARRNPKNNYRVYTKEEILEIAKLRGIKTISF
jgi:DNA-binding transcriptional MerR regulator